MVKEPVLKIHFMTESKYREQSDGDSLRHSVYILGGVMIANKETALSDKTTLPPMSIYSGTGKIC